MKSVMIQYLWSEIAYIDSGINLLDLLLFAIFQKSQFTRIGSQLTRLARIHPIRHIHCCCWIWSRVDPWRTSYPWSPSCFEPECVELERACSTQFVSVKIVFVFWCFSSLHANPSFCNEIYLIWSTMLRYSFFDVLNELVTNLLIRRTSSSWKPTPKSKTDTPTSYRP